MFSLNRNCVAATTALAKLETPARINSVPFNSDSLPLIRIVPGKVCTESSLRRRRERMSLVVRKLVVRRASFPVAVRVRVAEATFLAGAFARVWPWRFLRFFAGSSLGADFFFADTLLLHE